MNTSDTKSDSDITTSYLDDASPFTVWLRQELEVREWTYADLASRLSMNATSVAAWAAGRKKPTRGNLKRLRRLLSRAKVEQDLLAAAVATGIGLPELTAHLRSLGKATKV